MWFVVNVSAYVLLQVLEPAFHTDLDALTVVQVVLNLVAVIALAIFRRHAALGMVAAFGTTVWVGFLAGVFYVISLFAGGYTYFFRGYPPSGSVTVTYAFLIAAVVVGAVGAFPVLRSISKGIR